MVFCCCRRAHQDCAAKARKVLQDALAAVILQSRGGRKSDTAALAAAKAAAAPAAAAAIAAGDSRALDGAAAAVLGPLLGKQLVPAEQRKLLLPLLRLRQACIHPQVRCSTTDCISTVCTHTVLHTRLVCWAEVHVWLAGRPGCAAVKAQQ